MIESHWFQSSLNNAVILIGAPNIRRCSGQTRWLQSTARTTPTLPRWVKDTQLDLRGGKFSCRSYISAVASSKIDFSV